MIRATYDHSAALNIGIIQWPDRHFPCLKRNDGLLNQVVQNPIRCVQIVGPDVCDRRNQSADPDCDDLKHGILSQNPRKDLFVHHWWPPPRPNPDSRHFSLRVHRVLEDSATTPPPSLRFAPKPSTAIA